MDALIDRIIEVRSRKGLACSETWGRRAVNLLNLGNDLTDDEILALKLTNENAREAPVGLPCVTVTSVEEVAELPSGTVRAATEAYVEYLKVGPKKQLGMSIGDAVFLLVFHLRSKRHIDTLINELVQFHLVTEQTPNFKYV